MDSGTRAALMDLAGPYGAVGSVWAARTDGNLPNDYAMYGAVGGNLSVLARSCQNGSYVGMNGTGRAYRDPERARAVAIAEALERYAHVTVDETVLTSASAAELGGAAMDLDLVPRCSERELRRPGCPLARPDKRQPIRWRPGIELHTGSDVFVPAVMASLGIRTLPAERFWLPISTGAAAHTSFAAAIVNGICELIERDALAVVWLQRLPLPRLDPACVPEPARELVEWCRLHGVDIHLFDATTDVGVPTVYCLQTTRDPAIETLAQVVGCATDFDAPAAAMKAVLEATGIRIGMAAAPDPPRRYRDYSSVSDGALAMGRRCRRGAFGFLLDRPEDRRFSCPASLPLGSDAERLAFLLGRLGELGMTAYAVDITRRELELGGMVAVQTIIPQLQPMSLRPLAQYRGHRRLYEAPAQMGMRVLPESRLNPYPQPMA